jgi:hypothetical protein
MSLWGYMIGGIIFHSTMQYLFWWWLPLILLLNIPVLVVWNIICRINEKWDQMNEQLLHSLQS